MKSAPTKIPTSRPLQSGNVALWVLLWLAGLALIGFFCLKQHIPRLEARIAQQVQSAVAPLSSGPLNVSMNGYTATLEGSVADQETEQRILNAATEQTAARSVNNQLRIQPQEPLSVVTAEASDTTPAIATSSVDTPSAMPKSPAQQTVNVESVAPDTPSVNNEVASPIESPEAPPAPSDASGSSAPSSTASPTQPEAPLTPSDASGPSAPSSTASPTEPEAPSGQVSPKPAQSGLTISATVTPTPSDSESTTEPTTDNVTATNSDSSDISVAALDTSISAAPSLPAASLDLQIIDNAMTVQGQVSSETELSTMIASAIDTLSVNYYIDKLNVDANTAKADWVDPLEAYLPSLTRVKNLGLLIDDKQIQLSGSVASDIELSRIGDEANTLFKGYSLTNQLKVSSPASEPTSTESVSTQTALIDESNNENTEEARLGAERAAVRAEVDQMASTRILFRSGSDQLTEESKTILNDIASILLEYRSVDVDIDGHTDSQGSTQSNLELSQARANSVRDYLVDLGVSEMRLGAYGYGESLPITSNDTEVGRSTNRRIEFNF